MATARRRLDELREKWVAACPALEAPQDVLARHGVPTDPDELSSFGGDLDPWPVAAAAILHLDHVDRCCEASGLSMGYLRFAEQRGSLDRWLDRCRGGG